jgi:hypothetical protein
LQGLFWAEQTLEVNPADHLSGSRRDSRDAIGLPDIGENLSFHELQFV